MTLAAADQARKATLSGWIGSALEYYDFFIYATAAALVFPRVFFPAGNPRLAIVASLATYGVGYVARPIGAVLLGHWGDTRGRKQVLLVCLFTMGCATFAVGLLPSYQQAGLLAPVLLVTLRLVQGFAVAGELSGASAMILEHAPAGRRGYYASFTLQGVQAGQVLAAAVFLPLAHFLPDAAFDTWGWRVPFLLSALVVVAGLVIRSRVAETPVFSSQSAHGEVASAPVLEALRYCWRDMARVACMSLMNVIAVVATIFGAAYAVQPAYGIGFSKDVYLWIPVLGNLLAVLVIPLVGRLSDRIGRRPPIIVGALGSGLLAFAYLHAISIHSVPLAITCSMLMWGLVYQGYNAVFPSFYPELFPTRARVSAVAISQNLGTFVTAMLPALFAAVAPPGSAGIPWVVGSITFGLTIIAATAAWSARETARNRSLQLHTGLIGAGIGASRSPALHEDAARSLGLDLGYTLFDLDEQPDGPAALARLLGEAEARGFLGLNITHPVKQAVIPLLHELSDEARALGAVNTVVLRDGRRIGHNTDWLGFAESLRLKLPDAALGHVTLLGAGGAGSAVAYALLRMGASRVTLVDADEARATRLATLLGTQFGAQCIAASADVGAALADSDGLINATPVGMPKYPGLPLPAGLLRPALWVADIVYFPRVTPLLQAARDLGCRTVDGGGMVVFQAAEAFRLFTGLQPDPQRMLARLGTS